MLTVTREELGASGFTPRRYMHAGEQDTVLALVNEVQPRCMLEIGVNIGLTAQAVLRHVPTIERYIGVDVDCGYRFEIPAQSVERPLSPGMLVREDPRFELLVLEPGQLLRDALREDEAPEVVFIDGDHGRAAVKRDSDLAVRIVPKGGMIIWHDYRNTSVQVTPVLDAIARTHGRKLYHVEGTWLVFERR